MVSCGGIKNNLNKYKMKLDEIISNYTHYLTDENQNKWKVIETSDIEEICKEYYKQQLTIGGVVNQREQLISFANWLFDDRDDNDKEVDFYLAEMKGY